MLRSHTCGQLNTSDLKKEVTLCGWVHTRRDHGGLIFIDLRDRFGITQIVFDPSHNKDAHAQSEHLGREFVIRIHGHVRNRPEGMLNPKLPTGEIEVIADTLEILSHAETPPIEIDDRNLASEETRLKYRYLDLRRPTMQSHLLLRHKAAQAAREFLSSESFLEIETPLLVKTTPGGARVFKSPSRVHPGKFFSLPESPQIYKQLLMVSGFDRYFQLARCLRDEDLRADRQPEFTQIDLEMSFVDMDDVLSIGEKLVAHIFKKTLGVELPLPFPRMTFHEAMTTYGSDKPDLRFGLEFTEVTDIVKHSDFGVFKSVVDKSGRVFCLKAPGCANFSRGDIEELIEIAKTHKLPGLAWMKAEAGKLESNIAKYFSPAIQQQLLTATAAKDGDLLLFAADQYEKAANGLGQVRLHLGRKLNLIKDGEWKFLWVIDFPMYEWNDDANQWAARHHIFTRPHDDDWDKLESDPGQVRGKLYDIVLNGVELSSGSIRIHRKDMQERVLKVIGLTYEEAAKRFDFLLEAFKYGAPPHGGMAIGFDRLVALMGGQNDIREFIAFPRNKSTENPLDGSPQEWTPEFLKELNLKVDVAKGPK
ncbi:aspartate--tRNA ligase [Candidatus Woesearchaeota archaeon]|nr:MAG: aspartate--tRNA ligase [Candidatus Woesearchaeota archaeon]